MGKIVLLAVAAAWAAVLLPPLLRSRLENRPGSSVTDFRRQLSTLQRTVPTRSMTPMRSMARPLTASPLQRPAATGRPGGQMQRAHGITHDTSYTGELQRREHTSRGHRPQPARRISQREIIRRRRSTVLFVLVALTTLTLFLAATTQSSAMVYTFAFSFVSLCGYVYKLAQIRQYDMDRQYGDATWFNAA
ncbi:MAG: hypothetical protein JWN99_1557 [Ilumatobacteraceae bacterium]|nr:hypothetical protein [Ilumatobacteraceae bacterium]